MHCVSFLICERFVSTSTVGVVAHKTGSQHGRMVVCGCEIMRIASSRRKWCNYHHLLQQEQTSKCEAKNGQVKRSRMCPAAEVQRTEFSTHSHRLYKKDIPKYEVVSNNEFPCLYERVVAISEPGYCVFGSRVTDTSIAGYDICQS